MEKVLFVLFFILISAPSWAVPSWAPKNKCKTEKYNFAEESKITEKGNLGYDQYKKRAKRSRCLNEQTVLVYMAADNDLSPYSFWDLYEMERKLKGELNLGTSGEKVDVIVEWDNKNRSGIRRLHMFQSDKLYDDQLTKVDFEKMTEADILSPVIQILPEVGPGSVRDQSKRFENFLNWAIKNYPSQEYMVIIWGHGEGYIGKHFERSMRWDNLGSQSQRQVRSRLLLKDDLKLELENGAQLPSQYPIDKVFGGVAFDYSDLSFLDIPTLAEILKRTTEWVLEGEKINFLAFDACLMQSMEVATELSSSVQYLFGSTQIQNYLGLPYRNLIDKLNQGERSADLSNSLPQLVENSFRNGYQGRIDPEAKKTFTASVLNLHALHWELIPAIKDLSKQLKLYFEEDDLRAIEVAFILEQAEAFQGETRDLGVFLGLLLKVLYLEMERDGETEIMYDLRTEIRNTLGILHGLTLSRAYGDLYTTQTGKESQSYLLGFFRSFGIWLPKSVEQFEHRKKEFSESALWTSVPEWAQVLEILYNPEL